MRRRSTTWSGFATAASTPRRVSFGALGRVCGLGSRFSVSGGLSCFTATGALMSPLHAYHDVMSTYGHTLKYLVSVSTITTHFNWWLQGDGDAGAEAADIQCHPSAPLERAHNLAWRPCRTGTSPWVIPSSHNIVVLCRGSNGASSLQTFGTHPCIGWSTRNI